MTLDDLAQQINNNHLDTSQRLTAIETKMKVNHEAYGDIPARVASLEKSASWIKGVGATCGVLWTGFLAFLEFHHK